MDCYFQIGFGWFPDLFDKLRNMSEIYPGHVPDILKRYSKHGQHIFQICQHICQKMSRTYPTCLPDISKNVQNRFWEKSILGEIDFGKNRVSCMVHQVWFMYGTCMESRNPGIQDSRNPGIQESRDPGIQESRNPGIGWNHCSLLKLLSSVETVVVWWNSCLWKKWPSATFCLMRLLVVASCTMRAHGVL